MSEPEIDRRCPTCGASVRESAFFCPQCGKDLRPSARAEKTTQTVTAPLDEAPQNEAAVIDGSLTLPIERPAEPTPQPSMGATPRIGATPAPLGRVRGKIQRATNLARDVEGDVVHRVQKVREISSVVIDEAGGDPSLRFVLIAGALFVLFLVIVLLNKLIT